MNEVTAMIEPVEDQQIAAYYVWQQNGSEPNDPSTDTWWLEGGLLLELLAKGIHPVSVE